MAVQFTDIDQVHSETSYILI